MINAKDIRKTKKVYVEWLDSGAYRGWVHDKNFTKQDSEPSKICSIGYLIRDEKDYISITTSLSTGGSFMDVLSIPKCSITKKIYI